MKIFPFIKRFLKRSGLEIKASAFPIIFYSTPKLFFMIDFIIIFFSYILAVYISNSYEIVLALLPFQDLIVANINTSSRFVLFLPIITVVTGFITMIVTYAGIPRTKNETEVAGF